MELFNREAFDGFDREALLDHILELECQLIDKQEWSDALLDRLVKRQEEIKALTGEDPERFYFTMPDEEVNP